MRQQQQLYANYAGYGGLANDLRESQESAVSNSNVSEGGSHWFNSASANAAGVGGSLTGSMSFEADDALAASRASWDFAAAAGAATADETGGGAALPTVLAASPKSNLLQSPIYTGASPRAHKALLRLGSALKPPKYFATRPGRGAR